MADSVTLRPGTEADVDLVYAWANDPVTREVSFNTAEIPYEGHVAWYARQLSADGRNLFIAEEDSKSVAVVRLDRADGASRCVVSINVAPGARGRGIGTRVLVATSPVAHSLGFRIVVAYIRPSNKASVRAFEKAGYKNVGPAESVLGEDAHMFELNVAKLAGAAS